MNKKERVRKILKNPIVTTKGIFHCYVDERKLARIEAVYRVDERKKKKSKQEPFCPDKPFYPDTSREDMGDRWGREGYGN